MKIILAGESRVTEAFRICLTENGAEVLLAPTADTLPLAAGAALPIVLLQDAGLPAILTDPAVCAKAISALKEKELAVFLMDRERDAAPYAEALAIRAAAGFAAKKRRVCVLFRSSRAPNETFDDAYRKARNLGVTFIKYESLTVTPGDAGDTLTIFDGKLDVVLTANLLIDCAEAPSPELTAFAGALRLRDVGDGRLHGNRWFLSGDETFRRNVKWIDTLRPEEELMKEIPALLRELAALDQPGQALTAVVDANKCAFCYTCYRVCPHAALDPDGEARAMKVNDLLCAACGLCISVCPASAISFEGAAAEWQAPGKGKLKVFCCENSAYIAAAGTLAAAIEKIPCGGDLSAEMLTKALADYEHVLAAVCLDEGCKHYDGNKRLVQQILRLKERLGALGLDPERLRSVQVGVTMTNILADAAVAEASAVSAVPAEQERI
jgi:ferredoxin